MELNKKLILAIETSCDETSVAILEEGTNLLSHIISSQIETHEKYGGVVPEIASRLHVENIDKCINEALIQSNKKLSDISLIAVTKGPGLIGALHIGIQAAKAISIAYNIPIVGINHLLGHIYANNYVSKIIYPSICLLVSGGHSELIYLKKEHSYQIIGESLDDAIGEVYDKVARVLGLGYPGGPKIDKLSKVGQNIYSLPNPKTKNPFDFSFSGLKTAVINLVHNLKQKNIEFKNEDVASSFQNCAIDILEEKLFNAIRKYKTKQIILAGGVSANSLLREKLSKRAKEENIQILLPPLWCCTDNGAMIASAAYYGNQKKENLDFGANPNLKLNE